MDTLERADNGQHDVMKARPSLMNRVGEAARTVLRGHPAGDEQLSAAFEADRRSYGRRGVRIVCLVAIALITASAIIDAATSDENVSVVLEVRLACILGLSVIFGSVRTSFGNQHPRALALLTVVLVSVTLEILSLYSGGQASPQHFRENFLILGAPMLMTCSPAGSGAFALIVVGFHASIALATGQDMASPDGLRNLGFLAASSIGTVVITVIREGIRWRDLTRRHAFDSVQREVIEREQRYRSLVETASSAIILLAPDHRVLECNQEVARILALNRQDILGKDAFGLFLPENTWDGAAAELRKVFGGASVRGVEGSVLGADGRKRIFLWNISRFDDSEGRAVGVIAVGQDITKRRNAELEIKKLNAELEQRVMTRTAALQESEERFRAIFESSPTGMIIGDTTTQKIRHTNPAFQKLTGYSPSELRGMTSEDLTHPEDVAKSREALAEFLKGRTDSYRLEKRYLKRDGSVLWGDMAVFAVRDGAGVILHAFGMLQDITERKREEALSKGERSALELLAQRASLGEALTVLIEAVEEHEPGVMCSIMVADDKGERLRNCAAPKLPGEFISAIDGLEIGPNAGCYGSSAHRRTCMITENIAVDPLWAELRELALRHGIRACWSYPIVSPPDRLLGTLAMHHERPRKPSDAEAFLLRATAHVASMIIERDWTADLMRRHRIELAHAGRVSLVGELAASVAHELHQPLAAIANYANACVRRVNAGTAKPGQLIHPLEQISLLSIRAGEIIRHLRSLVRKGETRQEFVDVNELVRNAVRLVEPEARQHGIVVELDLAVEIPLRKVNSVQIEQVLLNLVNNGIEAITDDHGDGRELAVTSSVDDEGTIVLAVRNSGKSLSPASVERLFEPFYTTKTHGLGMGLAISRSIVETQGGRMWATPNPEGGMTFQFTLPRPKKAASHDDDETAS